MLIRNISIKTAFAIFLAMVAAVLCPLQTVLANPTLLRQSIIEYNLAAHQKSLSDGTYNGAEGILQIRPEVAQSLGLKVFVNDDYVAAAAAEAEAAQLFDQMVSALTTQAPETVRGEHAQQAGESALARKEALASARRHFAAYREKLTAQADERLNRETCSRVLDDLLEKSLKTACFNLREGLGVFYNRCRGLPEDAPPLTPENVRFVNHVFSEFQKKGSEGDKSRFDLGKQDQNRGTDPELSLKATLDREAPRLAGLITSCPDLLKTGGYPVDGRLFAALMKRESNFDPHAVSYVGAAGLTQIMPQTGKGLGMEQIHLPDYFEEAMSLLKRERSLRKKALSLMSGITRADMLKKAERARRYMQDSLACSRKRSDLFARYRKELVQQNQDDRLDPCKAIAYGYRYFSDLMRMHKGDMSLALAAYNAGPHRVKQYNGVPPYAETVTFRNTVLNYYREYLEKLKRAE